ncbi:MAG: cell wall metabolism sensor histidine kinase WalK [Fibrobacter sp.]|nr:cell wall metabolism sensor histidine kinase WalK [Fibrobacter sp.]
MRIRKIAWQFFLVCFAVVLIALWVSTWYSVRTFNQFFLKNTITEVSARAFLVEREISQILADTSGYWNVDSICKLLGRNIASRISVIMADGQVIGDSENDPGTMENHLNRPEIILALDDSIGIQERFSNTLKKNMLYIAVPVHVRDSVRAALRISVPIRSIENHDHLFYIRVMLVSFITFIILMVASYFLSQKISRPLRQIKDGAKRFASGDLDFKLPVPGGEELGEVAKALNSMAVLLDDRIRTITSQRNELDAILNAMAEGVIAVDGQERVISMNPAAVRILGVKDDVVKGKWLHEVIRNSSFENFLRGILESEAVSDATFVLSTQDGELHIQASGTRLSNGKNFSCGIVIVLNDVTQLKKLENMRKEFVANVSHELRTPLTSIKGFVETIRIGKYNLPDDVNHFLEIIASKTERLCSIVNDILSLSSIDRDYEHQEIVLKDTDLRTVINDAIGTCTSKAIAKKISISFSMDLHLCFQMNDQLMEQAVVNLLDNAIKYSDEGMPVSIIVVQEENNAVISVKDQGIGISKEHVNRVFERFYRVDKARSRKLGGTGLGLSIVKNIVLAHHGQVTVESEPGSGSTFRIILPIV